MDDPSEQNEPEDGREHEVDGGHQKSSLNQLPEAWNEEAGEGCDDVAGRTLSAHVLKFTHDHDSFQGIRSKGKTV